MQLRIVLLLIVTGTILLMSTPVGAVRPVQEQVPIKRVDQKSKLEKRTKTVKRKRQRRAEPRRSTFTQFRVILVLLGSVLLLVGIVWAMSIFIGGFGAIFTGSTVSGSLIPLSLIRFGGIFVIGGEIMHLIELTRKPRINENGTVTVRETTFADRVESNYGNLIARRRENIARNEKTKGAFARRRINVLARKKPFRSLFLGAFLFGLPIALLYGLSIAMIAGVIGSPVVGGILLGVVIVVTIALVQYLTDLFILRQDGLLQ